MKKRGYVRFLAFAMAFVLCLPLLPQTAAASVLDWGKANTGIQLRTSISELIKEYEASQNKDTSGKYTTTSGAVSGKWSDEKFRRGTGYTTPFEFDETLYSCTGFTLDYEILEVNSGNLFTGDFKYEVYVRLTSGTWKSVDTFWLDDYETTVKIQFDNPMSIDAVAVNCLKQSGFDFVYTFTVRNATCRESTISTAGAVSGYWSDDIFTRSNRSSYPFIFSSTISRCTGFTLNYEITEVTKGNLDGNFKFAVYVRNGNGDWKYVDDFKLEGDSIRRNVTFDSMSINAVAVLCLKSGNYNYSYNFTVTNPTTR